MTLDYSKVWESMNSLEMVTSKVCSAREILDSAIDALENHKYAKVEALMYAADEFLEYYLDEFDEKFKTAWNETVVKVKQQYITDIPFSSHNDDVITFDYSNQLNNDWENYYYPEEISTEYKGPDWDIPLSQGQEKDYMYSWGHSDIEALSNQKEDKVVKWRLPVEMDGPSGEYFVSFPDDLLEAAGLEEGDEVYWQDNENGTFTLRKVTKPLEPDEC